MSQDKSARSFVFFSKNGCLLPALFIFNLFFGWIFFKLQSWLLIEAVLLLLLLLNGYTAMRKIVSGSRRHDDAIDVKGEIVEEKRKLK